MNIPLVSTIAAQLWSAPIFGDFLSPEGPEDYFEPGDEVTYSPRPGLAYDAYIEAVDYTDNQAFFAYYVPERNDFMTAWKPFDMLTLQGVNFNENQNATAA
jgi:hypothetical protein